MKKLCVALIILATVICCSFAGALPQIGSHVAGPNIYLSRYYIMNGEEETGSKNLVTAVLADYRGFDTLCETTVLFLAGLTTAVILYKRTREERDVPRDQEKRRRKR